MHYAADDDWGVNVAWQQRQNSARFADWSPGEISPKDGRSNAK